MFLNLCLILEKYPDSDNFCHRANTFLKMHRYKDAINDCREAIRRNRRCVKAYLINACCSIHRGNLEKAHELLNKGLEITKETDNTKYLIQKFENEACYI